MTKTNEKIHVLVDEKLGGIKREYMEIDRKAEVGEKIVIVEKADCDDWYENGAIFTVNRDRPGKSHVESDPARCGDNINGFILREEYHVLEPTDIVHIDGQRYEMVDRNAKVGEKVIVVRPDEVIGDDYDTGRIGTVKSRHSAGDVSVETIGLVFGDEYCVLVPLDKHEKTLENKNNTYKEVKNYIHNELSITRQDIQEMISIAVSNEVQKMSESGKLDRIAGEKIESLIEEGFRNGNRLLHGFKERVSQTVSDEVGKRITNVLNINVELKEEGN
ncbi:hypothetical protein ACMXZI_15220 [Bacillus subtilis]|uniref:hypothetical protein n=1 Tax=Bacillus TaxID=1386 RepID=UPI0004E31F5E|nr:hypothetical protein [Bacillus]WIT27150.1 hypothetical protein [Bacillus phage SPbetaL2]KAA0936975.1 hypothetical protein FQ086_05190 [Bacillus sp. ANT_WA51]KFC32356.1 hypothetical protein ZQL_05320 [Bacillus subtilis]MCZ8477089.1 hypothetical protein [Bacillus subtilis]MDD9765640.1 hypothetical protein [Bacillus subtilis]